MKILVDQNISHRASSRLREFFPEIRHVKDCELQYATDRRIWQFARDRNFALMTFDADFNDLAILHGIPPKIIWLRFGNTLIQNLVEKLAERKEIITVFLTDGRYANIACLEIDN